MKQYQTAADFLLAMKDQYKLKRLLRDHHEEAIGHLNSLLTADQNMQSELVQALCIPDSIFFLVKYGQLEQVWSLICRLSYPENQLAVLSAPEVVFILSVNGKAQQVWEKIVGFPEPEQQLAIFTVPYAVFGLTKYGNPETVLAMLQLLPPSHQVKVLATDQVIYGLVDNLNDQGINRLIQIISAHARQQQAEILASYMAIFGLVKNGKVTEVLNLLKQLSDDQQGLVRDAAFVVMVLIENAPLEELQFFIRDLPEKRFQRSKQTLLSQYRATQRHLH